MSRRTIWGASKVSEIWFEKYIPKTVVFFTENVTYIKLHKPSFKKDKHKVCTGSNCKYCSESVPFPYILMPVYDVTTGAIRMIRAADIEDVGSLLSTIKRSLAGKDQVTSIIDLVNHGDFKWSSTVSSAHINDKNTIEYILRFAKEFDNEKIDLEIYYRGQ